MGVGVAEEGAPGPDSAEDGAAFAGGAAEEVAFAGGAEEGAPGAGGVEEGVVWSSGASSSRIRLLAAYSRQLAYSVWLWTSLPLRVMLISRVSRGIRIGGRGSPFFRNRLR